MRVQLQRRLDISPRQTFAIRLFGASAALLLAGVVLKLAGRSPVAIASVAFATTFGTRIGFEEMLTIATPVLMAAVAVAIGFRARVWNIGVAGQFSMGAWGATLVGLHFQGPTVLTLALMAIAGAVCGGLWALGPAWAKAKLDINEVVTTLLLNFVAVQWVVWWATDMWADRGLGVLSATYRIPTEIPRFPGAILLHVGVLVPIALVLILAVMFRSSVWGYEVDLTGGNPRTAAHAGIPVARRVITVLVLSGAVAGLSGMIQLAGAVHRLSGTLENRYGISGFMVAALAGTSFIALIGIAAFVAFLLHAGIVLSTQAGGITVNLVLALYGFILLAVGVAEVATRYRLIVQPAASRAPPQPVPPGGTS